MSIAPQVELERFGGPRGPVRSLLPAHARALRAWPSLVVCATGFCLLTAVAAQVRIPLPGTHVPMTLQGLAVLLAGYALRPTPAFTALALYVVVGTVGLPVFAPGSLGLAGPTGGYLIGFVCCAWLVSVLRGSETTCLARLFIAGLAGLVVLFAMGLGWNAVWLGSLRSSVHTGLIPFLPKAGVELCLAVALVRSWRAVSEAVARRQA